jgi:hypothetical protein
MTKTTTPTTPTTPTTTAPTTLWLTDRSRHKTGLSRCPRQRYLGYHFGATGYGITAKRESLPLATGLSVHQGLEASAAILAQHDRLPDVHEMRGLIGVATDAYASKVEARGYRGILGGPHTEETILEQQTLITGLLWALRLKFLPWLHQTYRLVAVEQERLHFLECSCGASPLDPDEHTRRGCTGKALMLRTDLLAARRVGGALAYFECKTTGWESSAWAEQWETDPQLALGTLDAERLWGREVTELYIVGLNKGRRAVDRYEDPADQRKRQLSPLCYGYCRPANPPMANEDWLPSYEWVTDDGETKRKSKAHRRRGVWELARSDWPTWRAYQGSDPEMGPAEFWVRMLPASLLEKVCFILGPMNRQDHQLASVRRAMIGDESRWQQILWDCYELQQQGHTWPTPRLQEYLDLFVPCSWACRPFGKEHQCEFVPICHRHQGWEDPVGSGGYQPRLPHHLPELQQAIARGLLPESAAEVESEEER